MSDPVGSDPVDDGLRDESGDEIAKPSLRRTSWVRIGAFVAWVVVVTLIAVPLLYRSQSKLGPGTFQARLSPSPSGATRVAVPPFGALTARTHAAPVRLNFELREVDVLDAINPAGAPGVAGIEEDVRSDIGSAIVHFAVNLFVVSAGVGAIAALTYPGRRSLARVGLGAVLAPVVIAALVAPAGISYDANALETSPELTGPLGSADTLLAKVGSLDTRFGTVSSRTEVLASKITDLYSAATTNEIARSDGEVALLHVSDLHLNSIGLALARDLADKFDVDAVIDTGDITSFGFEPEANFVEILEDFSMPYYVIAGNHDSESVRRNLEQSDAVIYLDGETAQVGDVTILGIGDPTVTALRAIPKDKIDQTYRRQFATTKRLAEQDKPDLVMVHNPVQLRPILGKVPAAAAGHLHKTSLEVIDGTVVAIVGSSGATGLGNLLVEDSQPYLFEILRFVDGRLVAVDEISLDGASGDFALQRRLLHADEDDTADEIPDTDVIEPSREELEKSNPEALDAVTSTSSTTTPTTTTGGP